MKAGFLLLFLGYLALLVAVGVVFSRRMKGIEDFFLASRRLSAPLLYFTVCASWIGASSVLVTTDHAFRSGLRALWLVGLPAVLTTLIFGLFLAGPIHRLPGLTLADLAEVRYGRVFRHLAALLIVWYMVLLAASQLVAVGSFLELFVGRSYLFCLAAGTAVVLLYITLGGFFMVAFTDRLHFFLLLCGLVALFFWALGASSPAAVLETASRPGREGMLNMFSGWRESALVVLSFVPAWLVSPIIWQRIQAARSPRTARRGLLASSATFLLVYALIVATGLLFLPLYGEAEPAHPLLAEAVGSRLPGVLAGLLFVAVSAAILSTLDTAVNAGAFLLTRDVLRGFFRNAPGRREVVVGRVATILLGSLAFLVATRFQSILKTLGLASEIMTEGLFLPGLAMLFMKRKLPLAGLFSLALGGGFSLAGFAAASGIFSLRLPPWPHSVPWGLGLGLIGFLFGAAVETVKRRRETAGSGSARVY
ncbi:MAG: sodium:solute symporter family protein [Candidatus Aminicenantes bacterium]|nr:sodium:solute symporter family protein [Candidatus Aminicenantes bacterium]